MLHECKPSHTFHLPHILSVDWCPNAQRAMQERLGYCYTNALGFLFGSSNALAHELLQPLLMPNKLVAVAWPMISVTISRLSSACQIFALWSAIWRRTHSFPPSPHLDLVVMLKSMNWLSRGKRFSTKSLNVRLWVYDKTTNVTGWPPISVQRDLQYP